MDDVLTVLSQGAVGLGILGAGVVAVVRLLRGDKVWKELLETERLENQELRDENRELRAEIRELRNHDN